MHLASLALAGQIQNSHESQAACLSTAPPPSSPSAYLWLPRTPTSRPLSGAHLQSSAVCRQPTDAGKENGGCFPDCHSQNVKGDSESSSSSLRLTPASGVPASKARLLPASSPPPLPLSKPRIRCMWRQQVKGTVVEGSSPQLRLQPLPLRQVNLSFELCTQQAFCESLCLRRFQPSTDPRSSPSCDLCSVQSSAQKNLRLFLHIRRHGSDFSLCSYVALFQAVLLSAS